MGSNKSKIAFEICVVTGDFKEIEDQPSIFMVLFDHEQHQSPTLSYTNLIQLEDDKIQAKFCIENKPWCKIKNFNKLQHIEFWRANESIIPYDWYLEKVIIRDRRHGLRGYWEYFFFPVHQWIGSGRHYIIYDCETFKGHEDPFSDIRLEDIRNRQEIFSLYQRSNGFPVEVENVPDEETFSKSDKWDIDNAKIAAINQRRLTDLYGDQSFWTSLKDLNNLYSQYNITEPIGVQNSIKEDICFGAQRLKGCNPFVIKLCNDIPENFEVTMEWLKPHLEGWTVKHVIKARRLYIVDYKIMSGLNCKPGRIMPAPMALFFFTEERQLKPLAIQLTQSSSEGNLVFLPKDPPASWLLAKMWFNMADACHHIIVGRLVNQMILENIYVSMRRNFGQSHPIYQILAPHFTNCLVVTKKLKEAIFSKDGWIAKNIQLSKKGIKQLVKRAYKNWSFDVNANIHKDLESRKVYDLKALSNYPYRDDALLIHNAFSSFVRRIVKLLYPNGKKDLLIDEELQNWRRELADPMQSGGMGIKGIPGGENNGCLKSSTDREKTMSDGNGSVFSGGTQSSQNMKNTIYDNEDLIALISGILHLSVIVCGSALRLPMYDEYGYPLNYALQLLGNLPSDPTERISDHDFNHMDEEKALDQVVPALPDKHSTLDVLISVRMAARVTQSVLGKFDIDYIYQPEALKILEEKQLDAIKVDIETNNKKRDIYHQYYCMDPSILPNYPGV